MNLHEIVEDEGQGERMAMVVNYSTEPLPPGAFETIRDTE